MSTVSDLNDSLPARARARAGVFCAVNVCSVHLGERRNVSSLRTLFSCNNFQCRCDSFAGRRTRRRTSNSSSSRTTHRFFFFLRFFIEIREERKKTRRSASADFFFIQYRKSLDATPRLRCFCQGSFVPALHSRKEKRRGKKLSEAFMFQGIRADARVLHKKARAHREKGEKRLWFSLNRRRTLFFDPNLEHSRCTHV